MTDPADRLVEDRRMREAAKANFTAGIAQVKADLGARSVPARVAAKAKGEAAEAMATGLEIAAESKGIIAAVAAAIGLWLLRAPLLRQVRAFSDRRRAARVQTPEDSAASTKPME
ncbi:MAG: hypothetical protein ACKOQ3_04780 [Novosphingobium sp.]